LKLLNWTSTPPAWSLQEFKVGILIDIQVSFNAGRFNRHASLIQS
jgi:hypothetical protein